MSAGSSSMTRKLNIVAVSLASLVLCCALAWWQWERFSSAGGSYQNLGYVLQWPLFGLFPAFLFWRMHKLKRQAEERNDDQDWDVRTVEGEPGSRLPVQPTTATRSMAAADAVDDEELAAYNRYLAELNARDRQAH